MGNLLLNAAEAALSSLEEHNEVISTRAITGLSVENCQNGVITSVISLTFCRLVRYSQSTGDGGHELSPLTWEVQTSRVTLSHNALPITSHHSDKDEYTWEVISRCTRPWTTSQEDPGGEYLGSYTFAG